MKINYNLYTKSALLIITLTMMISNSYTQSCYEINGSFMDSTDSHGSGNTPDDQTYPDSGHVWNPTTSVGSDSTLDIWFVSAISDPACSGGCAESSPGVAVAAIDYASNTEECGSPSICAIGGACVNMHVELLADESVSPPPRAVEASSYAAASVVTRAIDHDTETSHFLQQSPDSNDFAQYAIQHRNDPNDLDQWQRQIDIDGTGPNEDVTTEQVLSWTDTSEMDLVRGNSEAIHYDNDAQRTFSFDEISVGSEAGLGMAVMNDGYFFTWASIKIKNDAKLEEGSCN